MSNYIVEKTNFLKKLLDKHLIYKNINNVFKFCPKKKEEANHLFLNSSLLEKFPSAEDFIFCINHNLNETPKCSCGSFLKLNKTAGVYNKTCGNPACNLHHKWTQEEYIEKAKKLYNNKYDYSLSTYKSMEEDISYICPIHGIITQNASNHIRGHECPLCANQKGHSKLTLKEEDIKYRVEKLYEINYDLSKINFKKIKNSKQKVDVICPKHGIFKKSIQSLLSGHGCPECKKEENKKKEKNYYNRLNWDIILERLSQINNYSYPNIKSTPYKNAHQKVTVICPKHGEFAASVLSLLEGHGCPKCQESSGEKKIRNFLLKNNIKFESQKIFEGCKCKNYLKFDFYLPDYNTCIEYQGIQHYSPVDRFGGEENFKKSQIRDQIKRDFCKKEGISLMEIPYNKNLNSYLIKLIKN